jgi:hypothetical protein
LIYKEAARDQAQIPAGNPSIFEEGANSWPGKYPGKYRLLNMKNLTNTHQQNYGLAAKGLTIMFNNIICCSMLMRTGF